MSLVVCIGNELVADDAIGFEVHARLAARPREDVRLVFCGVGGLALLDLLDGTEEAMVVVDAVSLGAPVGSVRCMALADLPAATGNPISAHGIGLRETLEIGEVLYPERMPRSVTLVGIEGRCFDRPREHMSPEVSDSVERAVHAVLTLLEPERLQAITL
jgi:hydrogenase maturation protease